MFFVKFGGVDMLDDLFFLFGSGKGDDCLIMGVIEMDFLFFLVWKDGSVVCVKFLCVIVVCKFLLLVKLCVVVCVLDLFFELLVVVMVICILEFDLFFFFDINLFEFWEVDWFKIDFKGWDIMLMSDVDFRFVVLLKIIFEFLCIGIFFVCLFWLLDMFF